MKTAVLLRFWLSAIMSTYITGYLISSFLLYFYVYLFVCSLASCVSVWCDVFSWGFPVCLGWNKMEIKGAMAKSCGSAPSSPLAIPWHCTVAIHPSLKPESYAFGGKDPDDHLRLLHDLGTHCPCLILAASNDREYFKPAASTALSLENAEENAAGGDAAILAPLLDNGGKVIVFPEILHGWMTRGDIQQDATIKRDVQIALHETVEFIRRNMLQG